MRNASSAAIDLDPLAGTPYRTEVETLPDGFTRFKKVGEGGMGEVFLVRDTRLDRLDVAKVLHSYLCQNKQLNDRARLECQSGAKVTHENVVAIRTAGVTSAGRTYIAMERLLGETVLEKMQKIGRMDPEVALSFVKQAASGLAALHRHGIVHRDIKPNNVFLHTPRDGKTPILKILDLGIAKVVEHVAKSGYSIPVPLSPASQRGFAIATPRFAAPEQFLPDEKIDARVDIYALGHLLYYMVVGEDLFGQVSLNAVECANAHLVYKPKPPRLRLLELADKEPNSERAKRLATNAELLPESFDDLVLQCLAKAPKDRPQNATDLLVELEQVQRDLLAKRPFQPGDRVNSFVVKRLVKHGNAADVYEAEQPDLHRKIALKVLASEFSENGSVKLLRREASLLAKVAHKNVLNVLDVGETEEKQWMATAFIEGVTLKALMKQRERFSLREVLRIGIEVANGLAAAHAVGVVHLNVKPSNIFVSNTDEIIVADFAGASLVTGGQGESDVVGTPEYMAPELLLGSASEGKVDGRADVYSLGVVLYRMLCGFHPHVPQGEKIESTELMRRMAYREAVPLAAARPDLSSRAWPVFSKALSPNVTKRFTTMQAFREALEGLLVEEHLETVPVEEAKARELARAEAHKQGYQELPEPSAVAERDTTRALPCRPIRPPTTAEVTRTTPLRPLKPAAIRAPATTDRTVPDSAARDVQPNSEVPTKRPQRERVLWGLWVVAGAVLGVVLTAVFLLAGRDAHLPSAREEARRAVISSDTHHAAPQALASPAVAIPRVASLPEAALSIEASVPATAAGPPLTSDVPQPSPRITTKGTVKANKTSKGFLPPRPAGSGKSPDTATPARSSKPNEAPVPTKNTEVSHGPVFKWGQG